MPKLSNRLPKYCKLKEYAVVYLHGKIHYLGDYGSPESKTAYARLVAENGANPACYLPKAEEGVSIVELTVAFLDHVKITQGDSGYTPCHIIVRDFLLRLYGKDTPVDEFKPSCLKLVRSEMVQSRRFCRNTVNRNTQRIVSIFEWGVENEFVLETTWRALTAVKSLPEGAPGTFDHPEREDVPDSVIKATLHYMPPVLQAMVKVQRLTGMRPSEVFNMRVGEIDRHSDPDIWLYRLPHHKTEKKTKRKKVVPLGKPEQELIAPYLEGKRPEEAVFSPRTAMAERNVIKRANRKTKITPSQAARNVARAAQPPKHAEFYNRYSYWTLAGHCTKNSSPAMRRQIKRTGGRNVYTVRQ